MKTERPTFFKVEYGDLWDQSLSLSEYPVAVSDFFSCITPPTPTATTAFVSYWDAIKNVCCAPTMKFNDQRKVIKDNDDYDGRLSLWRDS